MQTPSSDPDRTGALPADIALPGASLPEAHACGGHAVQFYHSDDFLVAELAKYVRAGLDDGEGVVVIATDAHRNAMLQQLALEGTDTDGARRSGALMLLDAREVLQRIESEDGIDASRFHSVIGGVMLAAMQRGAHASGNTSGNGRTRAYGEIVDVLCRDGRGAAALALEGLWNELLSLHPFSLLCAYAMDRFRDESDAAAFELVCRAHGRVIPTEAYAQDDESARLAEFARLQQRASALENEIGRRRDLEAQLRDALAERDALLVRERAARAEAEAANEAKSVFLTAMSHELRTPLNAIAGYVDLLSSGVYGAITDTQRAPLDRIQHSQRHLLTMINDVLHFAKIQVSHVEYRHDAVPVAELFAHLEEITAPLAAARGIALRFDAHDVIAIADRDRMTQILLNLLSNALKFTQPGGRVEVTSQRIASMVEVTVRDTGCGIPRGQIDAIFDPFVQVGRRLSQPREGVGLGLTISRDLARAMHGDLRVESTEGAGSAFTLVLPAS